MYWTTILSLSIICLKSAVYNQNHLYINRHLKSVFIYIGINADK